MNDAFYLTGTGAISDLREKTGEKNGKTWRVLNFKVTIGKVTKWLSMFAKDNKDIKDGNVISFKAKVKPFKRNDGTWKDGYEVESYEKVADDLPF